MLQARLTVSFHCFSVRLMYLVLQLPMLVSTDCSVVIASSWVDNGLYHVVSRSISLACRETYAFQSIHFKDSFFIKHNNNRLDKIQIKTGSGLVCFLWSMVGMSLNHRCLRVWQFLRQMYKVFIPVEPGAESCVSCSTCATVCLCCFS